MERICQIWLKTLPVEIDADAIARGMLDLFTDDERVVLRFGMLPAEKMRCVETSLRERFLSIGSVRPLATDDKFVAVMADAYPGPRHIEFSLKALVSEALHEISLAIYKIGDLVV